MKLFVVLFALAALANASLLHRKTFKLNDGTVIVRTDIEKHTTVIKPGEKAQELLRSSDEDEDLEGTIPSMDDVTQVDRLPWSRMDKKIPPMTSMAERIPNRNVVDEDFQRDLMLRRILKNEDPVMNWRYLNDDDSAMEQKLRWMLERKNPTMSRIVRTDPRIEDALQIDRQLLIDRDPSLNLDDISVTDRRPWWMWKRMSPAINMNDDTEIDPRLRVMLRNDPTMNWMRSSTKNVDDISELGHDQRLLLNMRAPMINRMEQINPNIHPVSEMDNMLRLQKDPMFNMMLLQNPNSGSMDDVSKTNNLPWFLLHKNAPMMNVMWRKNPSSQLMFQRTPDMIGRDILPGMDGTASQPLRFKKIFKKFNPWMSYGSRKPTFGMEHIKPSSDFLSTNHFSGFGQNGLNEDFGALNN